MSVSSLSKRFDCARGFAPDPRLARALWQWLVSAALLVSWVPAARGDSVIGYLPVWLLVLPGSALLTAYRHCLGALLTGRRSKARTVVRQGPITTTNPF